MFKIRKTILLSVIITFFFVINVNASSMYSYNGAGQRLEAVINGDATRYVYDQSGNMIAETDEAGNILRSYVYAGGSLIAMVEDGEYYSYHFNGTGHTVAMTDDYQEIVNAYNYDPYGNILAQEEQINQPFKYVGRSGVLTDKNGLIYMRARYYDPNSKRFIKEDPIGMDGGINNFGYVNGNPISLVDPTGLRGESGFGLTSESFSFKRGNYSNFWTNGSSTMDIAGFDVAPNRLMADHVVPGKHQFSFTSFSPGGMTTLGEQYSQWGGIMSRGPYGNDGSSQTIGKLQVFHFGNIGFGPNAHKRPGKDASMPSLTSSLLSIFSPIYKHKGKSSWGCESCPGAR